MIIRILGDVTDAKNKMRELDASMTAFEKSVETKSLATQNSFTKIGSSLTGLGSSMQRIGAGLTTYVSIPLAIAGAQASKFVIDFEQAFIGVRKVMDATAEEIQQFGSEENFFQALKGQIRDLSTEIPLTHKELAAIMETAGRLGIRGQGALGAFTDAAAKLSITTGIASEELSMLLGRLVNIMGIDVETEVMKIADTITHLGNNTATTEKSLLNFATRMGGAGKLIGLTTPQILGIAAAADSVGIKAERGGTAMTKIFMAIQSEISRASVVTPAFTKHVQATSIAMADAQKKINDAQIALNRYEASGENNVETLTKLRKALTDAKNDMEQLTEVQGNMITSTAVANNKFEGFAGFLGMTKAQFKTLGESQNGSIIIFQRFIDELQRFKNAGGDVAGKMKELGLGDSRLMAAVLNLSEANNDGAISASDLARALGLAEAAWEGFGNGVGATDAEVNKFFDTTQSQMELFKNSINSIVDVIAGPANESFKEFLKGINEFLKGVYEAVKVMSPEDLDRIVKGFVGLIALGPGLTIAGGFVKSFGTAFSLLGFAVKGASDALATFNNTEVGKEVAKKTSGLGTSLSSIFKPKAKGEKQLIPLPDFGGGSDPDSRYQEVFTTTNGGSPRYRDTQTGKFVSSKIALAKSGKIGAQLQNQGAPILRAGMGPEVAGQRKAPLLTRMGGEISRQVDHSKLVGKNMMASAGTSMKKVGLMANARVGDFLDNTKVGGFFKEIAFQLSPITNFITSILPQAIPLFMGLASKMILVATVLGAISGGLALFFIMTGKGVEDINLIFENLQTNMVNLFTKIGETVDGLAGGVAGFGEKFRPIFDTVLVNLTNFVVTLLDQLVILLPKLLALGVELLKSLITGIVDSLPLLFESAITIMFAFIEAVWEMLPSILESGIEILLSLIDGIFKALPHLFKALADLFFKAVGFLLKIIMDGSLIRLGGQIIWGLIRGIGALGGGLLGSLGEIGNTIIGYFAGAGKWLWDAGKNMIKGLFDGVGSMRTKINEWMLEKLPGWLKEPFKFAMGIESPSRVFADYGHMMGQGLINGMADMQRGVEGATKEMAESAFFEPASLQKAIDFNTDGTMSTDYSGMAQAIAIALESVGLNVYMDGKDVTDIVSKNLVTAQRKQRA
jgi:TP901 family phage tail tape measure protein